MILTGVSALEAWCRQVTSGYSQVSIRDWTESWRSGLAFCAIIARFRPDLIHFHTLEHDQAITNCSLAFNIGEDHLGIPALLEPRDMVERHQLDSLSIITYITQLYHKFSDQAPVPATRRSLEKDDSLEENTENVTKDSGFDDSSLSSRETSPSFPCFSENEPETDYAKNNDNKEFAFDGRGHKNSKEEFLKSLLSENSSSPTQHSITSNSRSFESLHHRRSKPANPPDTAEDKASSFLSALQKFSSLSSPSPSTPSTRLVTHSEHTRSASSQTETSTPTQHSAACQTESYSGQYRDIYQTFYCQQGQLYATLV